MNLESTNGIFDPLAEEEKAENHPFSGVSFSEDERTDGQNEPERKPKKSEPMVMFWKPSALQAYEPPANQRLVGDYHLQRGAICVLAGPPGCGKSRAALWLALKGAEGKGNWLGFDVHCQFRTLILQNENGLGRLHRDFAAMELPEALDDWLRISEPPVTGLNLANPHFRAELKAVMRDFAPHLVVIDPWNALARDAMEKDYQLAFDQLRECIKESPENPACLIVHHLRKPKSEDRHKGRSLGNLLAGSYTILSVPRSALILQPASDDVEDCRVVVTPAKNNDGELGQRTAWERRDGGFYPVEEFNWEEYDQGTTSKPKEAKVKVEHLRELFEDGKTWLKTADAVRQLQEIAKVGRTAAYEALRVIGGRNSSYLHFRDDGCIGFKAETGEGD